MHKIDTFSPEHSSFCDVLEHSKRVRWSCENPLAWSSHRPMFRTRQVCALPSSITPRMRPAPQLNSLNTISHNAREMVQWVKHLVCKCEVLSSDPQSPSKSWSALYSEMGKESEESPRHLSTLRLFSDTVGSEDCQPGLSCDLYMHTVVWAVSSPFCLCSYGHVSEPII